MFSSTQKFPSYEHLVNCNSKVTYFKVHSRNYIKIYFELNFHMFINFNLISFYQVNLELQEQQDHPDL